MLQVASGAARFQQRRGVALSPLQQGTGSPARRSSSRSERKMPAPVTSRPRRAGTFCFGTQDLSRPSQKVAISGGQQAPSDRSVSSHLLIDLFLTYEFGLFETYRVRGPVPAALPPASGLPSLGPHCPYARDAHQVLFRLLQYDCEAPD